MLLHLLLQLPDPVFVGNHLFDVVVLLPLKMFLPPPFYYRFAVVDSSASLLAVVDN